CRGCTFWQDNIAEPQRSKAPRGNRPAKERFSEAWHRDDHRELNVRRWWGIVDNTCDLQVELIAHPESPAGFQANFRCQRLREKDLVGLTQIDLRVARRSEERRVGKECRSRGSADH